MLDKTCTNHPERAAIEDCEVCGAPLCAYCLYYTSDGQRLCKQHADQAEAAGAFIRSPGVYSGGLIPAQVSANQPKSATSSALYEGNTPDVVALIGMLFGAVGLSILVPGVCCLVAPVGFVLSLVALLGARDARNPKRTRTLAGIGIGLSGLWLLITAGCIWLYFAQIGFVMNNMQFIQLTLQVPGMQATAAPYQAPTDTPQARRLTPTASPSPTPSVGR
jgi:hypothetical protein